MIRCATSVSPMLLSLIRQLMAVPELRRFSLCGGTSLALFFGHRESRDIDLFSELSFDSEVVLRAIRVIDSKTEVVNRTQGSLCAVMRGIKVDLLHHPYPRLDDGSVHEGIRFVSLPDIAAMKVNAATNRGSKKDFSDLLLLHQQGIPLSQALDHFCAKYGSSGRFLAIRSLAWFGDADAEPDPRYLNGQTWEAVRQKMGELAATLIA